MYVAVDSSRSTYVFTENDPRKEGFTGLVSTDVSLDDEFPEILRSPPGKPLGHWLGISERNESKYRVFPSPEDCKSAGYRVLGTRYWTGKSWQDWQRTHHVTKA